MQSRRTPSLLDTSLSGPASPWPPIWLVLLVGFTIARADAADLKKNDSPPPPDEDVVEEVSPLEPDATLPTLRTVPAVPPIPDIVVEEEESAHGGFRIEISDVGSGDGEARIIIGNKGARGTMREGSFDDDRVSIGDDVWIDPGEVVRGNLIVIGGDANVSGEVEGAIFSIGGDVFVEGRVGSDLVAVLGDVEMTPEAFCAGDVLSIGGVVDQNGAEIEGESLTIALLPWLGEKSPQVRSALLAWVGISYFAFLIFTLLVGGAFRGNAARMVEAVEREKGRCLWVGIVGHVLVHVATVILAITIIGAPLAPIVWFVVWCASMAALTVGAAEAARGSGSRSVVRPALLAGTLAHAALFIGVHRLGAEVGGGVHLLALGLVAIGTLAIVWFTIVGSGALITTRVGGRSTPREPETPPAPLFEPHTPVRAS